MTRADTLRAQLLGDAATQSIARRLGIPVTDYVEKVVDYALHPQKQPAFEVVPDGVAKACGAATTDEVKEWLEGVAAGEVVLRDGRERDTFEQATSRGP